MSLFNNLITTAAGAVFGAVGKTVMPVIAAPVTRAIAYKAMDFIYGPAKGFFAGFARQGIAENLGHQAFNYAGVAGGAVGGVIGAAAAQGTMMLGQYALHKYKNAAYQAEVAKVAQKDQREIDMLSFEMDENKANGYKINAVRARA